MGDRDELESDVERILNLNEKDPNYYFDSLVLKHGIVNVVTEIYIQYGEKIDVVAKKIKLENKPKKEIKKIGIYYHHITGGGIERGLSLLSPMFIDMGYDVIIVTSVIPKKIPDYVDKYNIKIEEIPYINCGNKDGLYDRGQRLKDILANNKIDLLVYEAATDWLLLFDLLIAKSLNVYFVTSMHEVFSQFFVWGQTINYNPIKMVDAVITISEMETSFWKNYGVNTFFIPNSLTYVVKECKRVFTEDKEILWVGRFEQVQKQIFDAIDIFEIVSNVDKLAKLKIVGTEFTVKTEELQEYIDSKNLSDRVIIDGWKDDMSVVYSQSSLLLLTSAFESFCRTLGEAFSYGLPVVMYEIPYLELLKDNDGYISVGQGDKKAASKAICLLLSDQKYNESMGAKGKQAMVSFSKINIADKWSELIKYITGTNVRNEINVNSLIQDTFINHASLGFRYKNEKINYYNEVIRNLEQRNNELEQRNNELEQRNNELDNFKNNVENSVIKAVKNSVCSVIRKIRKN